MPQASFRLAGVAKSSQWDTCSADGCVVRADLRDISRGALGVPVGVMRQRPG